MITTGFWISYLALWTLFVLQTTVIWLLLRQVGFLHVRLGPKSARITNHGPEIGEIAPTLHLQDIDDPETVVEVSVAIKSPLLLVSVAPRCPGCEYLLPAAKALAKPGASDVRIVLVSSHPTEMLRDFRRRHSLNGVLLAHSAEFSSQWNARLTPYAFLVGPGGRLLSKGMVNHIEHLESLLSTLDAGQASMESWLGNSADAMAAPSLVRATRLEVANE